MKNHLKNMAGIFKAFGDEKRLQIIKMLASNTNENFCVSDIALQLDISQPAVSQHLKVLKSINLLDENRKGFRVFYTINTEVLLAYQNNINDLFRKAFQKCPRSFSCSQCSYNTQCK